MSANITSTSMRHHHHYHHHRHHHHHHHHQEEVASLATLQGGSCVSTSRAGALLYNNNNNNNNNRKGSAAGTFETSSSSASFPRFHSNLHGMSMDWTPEEQAILDEGLIRYASESNIARYAKIAMHLENKTIRDVALRCKWLSKRDFSKRRKEDFNLTRKSKDKKEKNPDLSAMSSHTVIQTTFPPYGQGVVANINDNGFPYNGTSEAIWQLLQQNVEAFEQISSNLVTHQIHENIGLLCQARDNISQILQNLDEPLNSGKRMPPLPVKVNEDLADFILPLLTR